MAATSSANSGVLRLLITTDEVNLGDWNSKYTDGHTDPWTLRMTDVVLPEHGCGFRFEI